jgi:hypothetical protein
MKATLHSAAVASYAGQFVWLDLNVDDPRNTAFLTAHMGMAAPVLLIIDPATGAVDRVWTGSATADQLTGFLVGASGHAGDAADQALRRGDGLLGRNDVPGATGAYEQALAAGGPGSPGRDHALEQLMTALQMGDNRACVTRATREAAAMTRNHAFVNVALTGVACLAGEPSLVASDDAHRLEALAREALAHPEASEDDHYQLYEALYAVRKAAGDPGGGLALAAAYLAYAEHTAPPASSDERLARDLARVRAAIKLGTPERVIPDLEATERALPGDANASAPLASAYLAAHRPVDAIAAATRGLCRAPGPSGMVRLLVVRANAEHRAHDPAAARRDLAFARDTAAMIGEPSTRARMTAQVQAQLDALNRP